MGSDSDGELAAVYEACGRVDRIASACAQLAGSHGSNSHILDRRAGQLLLDKCVHNIKTSNFRMVEEKSERI